MISGRLKTKMPPWAPGSREIAAHSPAAAGSMGQGGLGMEEPMGLGPAPASHPNSLNFTFQ